MRHLHARVAAWHASTIEWCDAQNRKTPMWDVFVRRWLDLAFWWLPKKEEAPPQRSQPTATGPVEPSVREAAKPAAAPRPTEAAAPRPSEPTPPVAPAVVRPEKPIAPPVPDDLTVIKGIGPAVQNKLRSLGISTFADLAGADPDALLDELKRSQPLTRARVHDWTEGARERVRS
jgi:predicted flap endonuclease-1-like 5' DNA nuclease